MKIKTALVAYYVHNYHSLEVVKKTLSKHKIDFHCVSRSRVRKHMIEGKDIIITVGGDGTFLRTAHYVLDTPVLAVSSDRNLNEGFFSQADKDDFDRKLHTIKKNKHKLVKLMRLEGIINNRIHTHLAINEIFVGSKRPYHTSMYTLIAGKHKEFQKSSGVLVYSGAGSNAWAGSAGVRREPKYSKHFHFVVREPYFGRLVKPKLLKGTISRKQSLVIKSSIHDGIVISDSEDDEHSFKDGDIIEIKVSKHPLNYITF